MQFLFVISIGIGHHRERNIQDDSPPPLPPKSPRITSKPARPHDFPQQLQLQIVDPSIESASKGGNGSSMVPPPPPRRQNSQKESQAKYLRLLQDQSANKIPHAIVDPTQSMTLPSPILPPTPPPDVVMESPMSDSGPIISPPPAFSTPVTPMVDRQNSTTSDKTGGASSGKLTSINHNTNPSTGRLRSLSQSTSHYHNITGFTLTPNISASGVTGSSIPVSKPPAQTSTSQQQQHHYHVPLSGTVSMSAISAVNGRNNNSRPNKSIPDLSTEASVRYSPLNRSRSTSSPMSPGESMPASSPEEDDEDPDEDPTSSSVADNGHDGDDDCSEKGQSSSISPKLLVTAGIVRRNSAKVHSHTQHSSQTTTTKAPIIPKSVTENFLYKVGNVTSTVATAEKATPVPQTDVSQQPKAKTTNEGKILF